MERPLLLLPHLIGHLQILGGLPEIGQVVIAGANALQLRNQPLVVLLGLFGRRGYSSIRNQPERSLIGMRRIVTSSSALLWCQLRSKKPSDTN